MYAIQKGKAVPKYTHVGEARGHDVQILLIHDLGTGWGEPRNYDLLLLALQSTENLGLATIDLRNYYPFRTLTNLSR
jgi:hypothetical protein